MRLDYLVATSTAYSRKDVKKLIQAGRITVEGSSTNLSGRSLKAGLKVCSDTRVWLDGELLVLPQERYYMLNKPLGRVCSTSDPDHPVVTDLLPSSERSGVHIAGRLDLDTTGLVLLTTDGKWSHRITAPSRDCPKRYRVNLALPLADDQRQQLEQGVQLRNEPNLTRPAHVTQLNQQQILLVISEGRYHQVKRMLAAVGNRVTALHREAVGGIELDPALAPGEFRPLTEDECQSV